MNILRSIVLFTGVLVTAVVSIAQTREIAVTIDDLPVVSTRKDLASRQRITKNLLSHIEKAKMPAIGFVNENKLYIDEKPDDRQIDLLRMWLDAGLELGNHTFSHLSLSDNPLSDFEAEILKGELITKPLMRERNLTMRYFRHPYLATGLSLEIKRDLAEFLTAHGYTIAPVTVDNGDWIFASAYDKAFDRGDRRMMRAIGDAYIPYLNAKLDYWERQSVKLFGREIPQILLLHANFINSDYLDDIARALKKRKYRFVTLEHALKDDAYRLPDTFTKRAGISWLHRWALEKGREYILPDEPTVPDLVLKAAGVASE